MKAIRYSLWMLYFLVLVQSAEVGYPQVKSKSEEPKSGVETEIPGSWDSQNRKDWEVVDQHLRDAIESKKIAGCSALVIQNGREEFFGSWGFRETKMNQPCERDTVFRIYSMTKPIVSIAALQLVERGNLELDASLSRYLPEFSNPKVLVESPNQKGFEEVDAQREITVRDLLRHSSGLTYGFFGNSEVDRMYKKAGVLFFEQDLSQLTEKLGKLPLLYQPGTRFHYSVSSDVLGRVIEVASKQDLNVYLQNNIFNPLDMSDTSFNVPADKLQRLAELYRPDVGGITPCAAWESMRFKNPANRFYSGGHGLCSTIDDYANFCRMLLNTGQFNGRQVVSEELLNEAFTDQLDDLKNKSTGFQFGLGFRISRNGDLGWGGAAGTRFWINREKDLLVLYMVQIKPDGGSPEAEFLLRHARKVLRKS
ncbi:MAG: serine hydrolase domain-containing protein [Planctomycetota bacterium]